MVAVASAIRVRRPSLELKTLLLVGVLLFLAFGVLYPLVLLVVNSFTLSTPNEPTRYGLGAWRLALSDRTILASLGNTWLVWIARQGIGFPIAILIAWLIARTNIPGGRWLEFLFWISFFLPSLAVIQAWILLLQPTSGLINQALAWLPFIDNGPFNIYSFWGIIWVHLGANTISLKVMLLTPAFRNMDASLEEASTVSGASPLRTMLRVTIPMMVPALVVMLMLSTVRTFQTAETEIVLGSPIRFFVFGSKIFSLIRQEPAQYGAATALAVMILMIVIPMIVIQRWAGLRRSFATVTGQFKPQVLNLRRWKWVAFGFVMAMALVLTALPAISLLVGTFMKFFGFLSVPTGAWTTRYWTDILSDADFKNALKNTLVLAVSAATLSMLFFSVVAYVIVRTRSRVSATADYWSWFPQAMPGVLVALAWLWIMLQTPIFRPLYGTMWSLILVMSISGITLSVAMIKANLLQMGTDLEEASFVAGAGLWTTMRTVMIPLLMPILLVVWIINFMQAADSSVVPAMLAAQDTKPLAALQLDYMLSGANEQAAVIGVVVVFLTVGVAIAARMLGLRIGLRA